MQVKKDDTVMVISGKDKGKSGKIIKAFPKENKVLIQGLNMVKRHTRLRGRQQLGGIIDKEAPIHVSNVKFICPACGKPTRLGEKFLETGEKVRVCKKCNEIVDKR
jgi:large subunit ribosomal protein L24